MTSNPKKHDEQGKNPQWQTPMRMEGVQPEQYPERGEANPAGKTRGSVSDGTRKLAHQQDRSG